MNHHPVLAQACVSGRLSDSAAFIPGHPKLRWKSPQIYPLEEVDCKQDETSAEERQSKSEINLGKQREKPVTLLFDYC